MDLYGLKAHEVPDSKIVKYLGFKMKCARLAEKRVAGILDYDRCEEALAAMEPVREEKIEALKR